MSNNLKVYSSLKDIDLKFIGEEESDLKNSNKLKNILEYKIIVIGDN